MKNENTNDKFDGGVIKEGFDEVLCFPKDIEGSEKFKNENLELLKRCNNFTTEGYIETAHEHLQKCLEPLKETVISRLTPDNFFKKLFDIIQKDIHHNACEHGWHKDDIEEGTAFALIHGEVSEAMEAAREGNKPSEKIPDFSSIEEEMADIVIRCMDWSEQKGYRLADAIVAKHEFNKTRPYKHGGKLF